MTNAGRELFLRHDFPVSVRSELGSVHMIRFTVDELDMYTGVQSFQEFVFDTFANRGGRLTAGNELVARVAPDGAVHLRLYDLHSDRTVRTRLEEDAWNDLMDFCWDTVRDEITARSQRASRR